MRRIALVSGVAAAAMVLAGCAGDASAPDPTPSDAAPSASATDPAPSETVPPEPGSADALLPTFAQVLADVDASQDVPQGDPLVEALAAAGFDRAAIERTADLDSVGEPVVLLTVSVRVGEQCLLGQVGEGEPTSRIAPVLGTGLCLVGQTVPVD